ncbi:hypothetical protein SAMN05428938_7873 [Streptomyces sp. KS_5]|nr:hypothetical protein SAMN05428938_7873 [Streptomyces sp. KS_5]
MGGPTCFGGPPGRAEVRVTLKQPAPRLAPSRDYVCCSSLYRTPVTITGAPAALGPSAALSNLAGESAGSGLRALRTTVRMSCLPAARGRKRALPGGTLADAAQGRPTRATTPPAAARSFQSSRCVYRLHQVERLHTPGPRNSSLICPRGPSRRQAGSDWRTPTSFTHLRLAAIDEGGLLPPERMFDHCVVSTGPGCVRRVRLVIAPPTSPPGARGAGSASTPKRDPPCTYRHPNQSVWCAAESFLPVHLEGSEPQRKARR